MKIYNQTLHDIFTMSDYSLKSIMNNTLPNNITNDLRS